ncbi:hypothetical protein [Clostridium rectalis]|uniref:hypothetical protein n=1 Tax=Clostridium rectalis TaxID=2040295 RepID=UPI000F62DA09|nr:hypothetical protein [Clostridium rectalis]
MLSKELHTFSSDFVEKLEKQEELLRTKDEIIQEIMAKIQIALINQKNKDKLLNLIIEEYKEDI